MQVFDRAQLRRQRRRAAWLGDPGLAEAAEARLLDRLDDVRRGFTRALVITPRVGGLAAELAGRGVGFVAELALDAARPGAVLGDEEFVPFGAGAFDLVLAPFCLHWTNDLPGCLLQLRRVLVPDGLLLANLPGLGTLGELRTALLDAEIAASGGAHPRVSPFADLRDAAGLLQRAGFALPVADLDRLTLGYRDPITLLRELRASGETNAVLARARRPLRRGVLFQALAGLPRDPAGRVKVAVELVTISGWAPAATQQKPLRPGSGSTRLADALGVAEIPAGESPAGDPKRRSGQAQGR